MNWQLAYSSVDLEQEDVAIGFLGVQMEHHESGLLEAKHEELIDHMIEALGLDVGMAEAKALVKDTDGEVAHGDFSCSTVMGVLLYPSGHS